MESKSKKLHTDKFNLDEENTSDKKHENSIEKNVYKSDCTLTYDIWRMVFKYLNGRDLSTAAKVCRTWKEATEKELALHSPEYLLAESSELKTSEVKNIVDKIRINPRVAVCFCENTAKIVTKNVKYCLCKQLPHICDVVYIDTCVAELRTKKGIEKEIPDNTNRAGCMFLPNLQEFDIKVYHQSWENTKSINIDQRSIHTLAEKILQHNGNSKKCLIMFCDDASMSSMHKLLDTLKKKINNTSLMLIGGRVNELYVCKYRDKSRSHDCKKKARLVTISISKPGMESWSIVIKRNCYKEEQIVAKLTEFEKKIQFKKHTFAIMFGCCARIENKHVEIDAFRKAFPNVQLICGYGNEEFGVDTLEYNPTSKNKTKFYTNYSTIFSIITYS